MPRSISGFLVLVLLLASGTFPPRLAGQDVPEGNAQAVSAFAEGLELYQVQRYAEALPHLYKAYELDDSFVVSLFHAALCESNLGSDVSVDSLLRIVLEKRDRLSPYYVHRAESYMAKMHGERELAIDHLRKAAAVGPGTKAWYNLAYDLMQMNKPREAREALMRLDPDEGAMDGWYSYWGLLASANHALGRFEEAVRVIREGKARFPKRRAALIREAESLAALGRLEDLDRLFDEAGASPATGAGNTVGALMIIAAAELKAHGSEDAGDRMYHRAVDWYRGAGEAVASPVNQTWYTLALYGADQLDEALENCDRHLAVQPDYTWYHGMAWLVANRTGDPERAAIEQAYYEETAKNRSPRFLPLNMAFAKAAAGEIEESMALLNEAMELGSAFSIWWHRDPTFDAFRDHPAYKEFLRPKG